MRMLCLGLAFAAAAAELTTEESKKEIRMKSTRQLKDILKELEIKVRRVRASFIPVRTIRIMKPRQTTGTAHAREDNSHPYEFLARAHGRNRGRDAATRTIVARTAPLTASSRCSSY